MTTKTRNRKLTSIEPNLSPTEIFSLLSNDERRYALHYLSTQVGAISLGEVAEQIAIRDHEPTKDRYERAYVGLIHIHVPKLENAGVVEYQPNDETIALSGSFDALLPYLNLAEANDVC